MTFYGMRDKVKTASIEELRDMALALISLVEDIRKSLGVIDLEVTIARKADVQLEGQKPWPGDW